MILFGSKLHEEESEDDDQGGRASKMRKIDKEVDEESPQTRTRTRTRLSTRSQSPARRSRRFQQGTLRYIKVTSLSYHLMSFCPEKVTMKKVINMTMRTIKQTGCVGARGQERTKSLTVLPHCPYTCL